MPTVLCAEPFPGATYLAAGNVLRILGGDAISLQKYAYDAETGLRPAQGAVRLAWHPLAILSPTPYSAPDNRLARAVSIMAGAAVVWLEFAGQRRVRHDHLHRADLSSRRSSAVSTGASCGSFLHTSHTLLAPGLDQTGVH